MRRQEQVYISNICRVDYASSIFSGFSDVIFRCSTPVGYPDTFFEVVSDTLVKFTISETACE